MARVVDWSRLAAQDAIRRTLQDYCRGVDRADLALVTSAYHRDAVDEHGTFSGPAADRLPAALSALVNRTVATVHFLGESSFDWSADRVRVETYVLALHVLEEGDETRPARVEQLHGRYLDVFTCRDGDWRISERAFVRDADQLFTAPAAYVASTFLRGRRATR